MKQTNFHIQQTDRASAMLFDGDKTIAEIYDLKFCNVRLQPHGKIIIGESVPMPLYWWQYANHQHPEYRNRIAIFHSCGYAYDFEL